MASKRIEALNAFVEDYDPKKLATLELDSNRYLAVEEGPKAGDAYVSAHSTVPAACRHLQDMLGMGWTPKFIADLDTGERIELSVSVVIVPRTMGAVVVPMSKGEAQSLSTTNEKLRARILRGIQEA